MYIPLPVTSIPRDLSCTIVFPSSQGMQCYQEYVYTIWVGGKDTVYVTCMLGDTRDAELCGWWGRVVLVMVVVVTLV